ncbi:MAG: hypothetical protein QM756_47395 [Polyangiaceae bacterium]
MAKKYGVHVRFYMMLGNRGETAESFRETLDFLSEAKPHQYIFSCLSIYPGTKDFQDAEAAGWLEREEYFRGDFQELKVPFDASEADTRVMTEWFAENHGLQDYYLEGVAECRAILERLGDHAPGPPRFGRRLPARRAVGLGGAAHAPRVGARFRRAGLGLQLPGRDRVAAR